MQILPPLDVAEGKVKLMLAVFMKHPNPAEHAISILGIGSSANPVPPLPPP